MKMLIAIVYGLLCSSVYAKIPNNAIKYLPILKQEAARLNSPVPVYVLAGLIQAETCITVNHKHCWSPRAQYRTKRELGIGFGMITKTYRRNGRVRFDTLRAIKRSNRSLRKLTWGNMKNNPRLQIRALIVYIKTIWNNIPKQVYYTDRLAMVISAYNQGSGGLKRDIRLCKKKKGCDYKRWNGHVRMIKRRGFGTKRLYGTRSTGWTINRKHVSKTLKASRNYKVPVRRYVAERKKLVKKITVRSWTPIEKIAITKLMR